MKKLSASILVTSVAALLATQSGCASDRSFVGTYQAAHVSSPTVAAMAKDLPPDLQQRLAASRRVLELRGDHTATIQDPAGPKWEMKWSVEGDHLILQQTAPKAGTPVSYTILENGNVLRNMKERYGWTTYTKVAPGEAKPTFFRRRPQVQETMFSAGQLGADVAGKVRDSMVLIVNLENGQRHPPFTGFITSDGENVVTAGHVVKWADHQVDPCEVIVGFGTPSKHVYRVEPAEIQGKSGPNSFDEVSANDVAVIHLPQRLTVGGLKLKDAASFSGLEHAFTAGYSIPDRTSDPSVAKFKMQPLRASRVTSGMSTAELEFLGDLQGSQCGSPVINSAGEVLGILEARTERSDGGIYVSMVRRSASP